MWMLWRTNDLKVFEETCKLCYEKGFKYVSIEWDWMLNNGKSKIDILKKYGLYVMAYTSNDLDIMYQLYDIGVDCIFTDFTFI